jgi:hypothetical protein
MLLMVINVFDDGELMMDVAGDLWLPSYLQFYTDSFLTLQ